MRCSLLVACAVLLAGCATTADDEDAVEFSPTAEYGTFDFMLTPLDPGARFEFLIEDSHEWLHTTLFFAPTTGARVNVSTYGPDGGLWTGFDSDSPTGSGGMYIMSTSGPPLGSWSLEVRLVGDVAETGTVGWCARGAEDVGGTGSRSRFDPCMFQRD